MLHPKSRIFLEQRNELNFSQKKETKKAIRSLNINKNIYLHFLMNVPSFLMFRCTLFS